jgi:hypothetical protein
LPRAFIQSANTSLSIGVRGTWRVVSFRLSRFFFPNGHDAMFQIHVGGKYPDNL